MALEKMVVVDRIEIIENGCIQVRKKTVISENSEPISSNFHRHVVSPGDDYSQEDPKVRAICAAIHTPDVIAAFQNKSKAK